MTSVFKPLKSVNTLVLAGILAAASLAATAQTVAPAAPATASAPDKSDPTAGHHDQHRHDPAKMQARIAQHQAELKAKLAITPAQEGAWSAYTSALQPQAPHAVQRPDRTAMRAEVEKLTTPQRIDKMNALRTQHMAEMNAALTKRGDAIKSFYAALNADQQKVFDAQRMGRGGKGHPSHHNG
ncbi:MAG: Spy/CpxP family protein refolding chaperone [Polaromonas sp.]|uniref:Spy/CpxP family protein refolding chaperone n=1 Tax=Polaromonas sp. TaxID=1869339 RepID=UPI002735E390|nr:Spy/CpxP family protein refolding chaperone [Polaromonas sp.]MDP2819432.1 Spy/CpxP family protein refolding chaperone [Polaromonas sp.]